MAYTDREDLNYLGKLFLVGAYQTPLLNMMGGMGAGKTTKSFTFPVAQPWSLTAASQPAISEATSVTTNTATTVTRGQDYNTVQIFQETVEVSHAKQSTTGEFSGIQILGDQPVMDEYEFQKMAALRQMAIDMEFTFFQGAYQLASDASTAAKSRGLENAISTNEVAAGSVALSKALIDEALRTGAGNGAQFENMVLFANAFQLQKISDIYGYAPEDREIGGVAIKTIYTDFAKVGVVYAPQMPTDEIYIVDMSVMAPVFCPVNGQVMVFEDLAQIAASKKGQWYAQVGLDYGPEEYHMSVTGLATS